jgi:hypothetical protein
MRELIAPFEEVLSHAFAFAKAAPQTRDNQAPQSTKARSAFIQNRYIR